MNRSILLAPIVALLACASGTTKPAATTNAADQPAASASNGDSARTPSTPEERAWAVKVTRELENDPLSADLAPEREKLVKWLVEVPDITVEVCADSLGPEMIKNDAIAGLLVTQQMFSQAAYGIEHPGEGNSLDAHVAGVEGVLKAYSKIRAAKPEVRNAHFDELAALEAKGKLKDWVEHALGSCKKQ